MSKLSFKHPVVFISILVIVCVIAIFGANYLVRKFDTPRIEYSEKLLQEKMESFSANEELALQTYQWVETYNPDSLYRKLRKNVVLWQLNKKELQDLNSTSKIPVQQVLVNNILLKYCDLRIEHDQLMIQSIMGNTPENNKRMNEILEEIDVLLKNLE